MNGFLRLRLVAYAGLCFAVVLFAVGWAGPAAAAEKKFPTIEGVINIEIEDDWNHDSDSADNRHNQLFAKIQPEITVRFSPEFSLFAHLVLTPVTDPDASEDRIFKDHGLFLEDFYLNYEIGRFGVKGGKLKPNFGVGYDENPGVFGRRFAQAGYEFAERIGVVGSVAFGNDRAGKHRLEASTFFLDTTVLAQSTLKSRGTRARSDGGVSNTEDLSSFALSFNGEDVGGIRNLRYHAAFIHQAKGVNNTAAETGYAIALMHKFDLAKDLSLSPLVEYVHFDDAEGARNQDRDFITLASTLNWKSWNLALVYVDRDTKPADGSRTDDYLFQISAGYEFGFGLAVDLGWSVIENSNIETQSIGLLFKYKVEF